MEPQSETPLPNSETGLRKENLSDETMGNLLAAVGNHEAKALLLSCMGQRPHNIFTYSDLGKVIGNAQGLTFNKANQGTIDQGGWLMKASNLQSYCLNSFAPIGLVAQEVIDTHNNSYGFRITSHKGMQYGLPLAGMLLKFSFENKVPLDYLFGGTSSSAEGQIPESEEEEEEVKKRPPSSHYRIFRELLSTQDPITAAELVKKMGLPYAYFAPVLKDLNRHGVITYQSIKSKQPISSYRLSDQAPDQPPPTVKTNVRLTQEVYNVIKRIPDKFWTIDEVSEAVTTDGTSRQNTPSLKAEISRILGEFERTNYTAKNSFSHENMSKIGLSEDQRELLSKLMTLLYKFKNQDPQTLTDGLRSAREFALENPQKAREIMLQAYRVSSHAGRDATVTQSSILEAIENQPSHFQTMDGIITFLKDTYQLEVSPKTVQRYIRDLSSHKLISFDGSGWKTTSNSPNDVS